MNNNIINYCRMPSIGFLLHQCNLLAAKFHNLVTLSKLVPRYKLAVKITSPYVVAL